MKYSLTIKQNTSGSRSG